MRFVRLGIHSSYNLFRNLCGSVPTGGPSCGGRADEAAERRGHGEDEGEDDYWAHLQNR